MVADPADPSQDGLAPSSSDPAFTLPLGPAVSQEDDTVALAAWKVLHKPERARGPVFLNSRGERLARPGYGFDPVTENFRRHCLRHTFASRLVMVGVDVRTAQELTGPKSGGGSIWLG